MSTLIYSDLSVEAECVRVPLEEIDLDDDSLQTRLKDHSHKRSSDIVRSVVTRGSKKFDDDMCGVRRPDGKVRIAAGFGRGGACLTLAAMAALDNDFDYYKAPHVYLIQGRTQAIRDKLAQQVAIRDNFKNKSEKGYTVAEYRRVAVALAEELPANASSRRIFGYIAAAQDCCIETAKRRLYEGRRDIRKEKEAFDPEAVVAFKSDVFAAEALCRLLNGILRLKCKSYTEMNKVLGSDYGITSHIFRGDNERHMIYQMVLSKGLLAKREGVKKNFLIAFYNTPKLEIVEHPYLAEADGLLQEFVPGLCRVQPLQLTNNERVVEATGDLTKFLKACKSDLARPVLSAACK